MSGPHARGFSRRYRTQPAAACALTGRSSCCPLPPPHLLLLACRGTAAGPPRDRNYVVEHKQWCGITSHGTMEWRCINGDVSIQGKCRNALSLNIGMR